MCVAPTGGFVVHRLVLAGSALQPGERGVCCLGLSFPASETVFHKCSASGKCRGPHGLCSSLRSWRSALRDPGGRSPGREAGVGGTGAGGPALASAPRQARSPALPSASLRLWPGRHRCFPATTDSACGAPGGGGAEELIKLLLLIISLLSHHQCFCAFAATKKHRICKLERHTGTQQLVSTVVEWGAAFPI